MIFLFGDFTGLKRVINIWGAAAPQPLPSSYTPEIDVKMAGMWIKNPFSQFKISLIAPTLGGGGDLIYIWGGGGYPPFLLLCSAVVGDLAVQDPAKLT